MKTSPCIERRVALFPGSFDPFTIGHESIVRRALSLFDEVVIAIGVNAGKHAMSPAVERQRDIERVFSGEPRVRVVTYDDLTADVAAREHATCLLRGVRTVQDFESEMTMAQVNHELCGIETVLLYTLPQLAHVSSSLVRELHGYGRDITPYLPQQDNRKE